MVKSLMHFWLWPRSKQQPQQQREHDGTPGEQQQLTSGAPAITATFLDGGKSSEVVKRRRIRLHKITDVDETTRQNSNPFILTGYRNRLGSVDCLRSLFQLHNETINIWSHLIGFAFFAGLFVHDLILVIPAVTEDGTRVSKADFLILSTLLICYQATMVLSSLYHTFSCHASDSFMYACLSLDILGITLGLMGTFLSGIYYAFWCDPGWRDFYLLTVGGLFLAATALQLAPERYSTHPKYATVRISLFFLWAVYGFVPTIHWTVMQWGGPVVMVMVPRILVMYAVCGAAFFFYLTKMPERLAPGLVDIIGHSHQWWHVLIFLALLFWHKSGLKFAVFRLKHGCVHDDIIKDDLAELAIF